MRYNHWSSIAISDQLNRKKDQKSKPNNNVTLISKSTNIMVIQITIRSHGFQKRTKFRIKKKRKKTKRRQKPSKNSVAGQTERAASAHQMTRPANITRETKKSRLTKAQRKKHNERRKTYQSYPNPKIELPKRPKSNRPSSPIVFRTKQLFFTLREDRN